MTQQSTIFWLKAASAMTIGFGLMIAAAAWAPASGLAVWFLDLIFFPLDGAQGMSGPDSRLVSAICGGVMAGWGVLIWALVSKLYVRETSIVRQLIWLSLGVWFAVDSTASMLASAPVNVIGNFVFLLAFYLPLILSRKA
ncbi:MAG: excinuclease ABC subunit A [Alphaproteobacteria bacterium]